MILADQISGCKTYRDLLTAIFLLKPLIENIPGDRGGLNNLSGIVDIFMGIFTFNLSRLADGIQNFGAGMVFYGGFIGGVFAVTLFIRKQNLNWKSVADWMVPYLVLGHSIGRIGCFLVGDDYGKATDGLIK